MSPKKSTQRAFENKATTGCTAQESHLNRNLSQVKPIGQEMAAVRKTPYLIILYSRVGEDRHARASADNMEKHRDQQRSQGKDSTVEKSLYCRV